MMTSSIQNARVLRPRIAISAEYDIAISCYACRYSPIVRTTPRDNMRLKPKLSLALLPSMAQPIWK